MDKVKVIVVLPDLTGIHGWLSQAEAVMLSYGVKITAGLLGELMEIGSYCGKSTVVIGDAAKRYQAGVVYAVDPHKGFWVEDVDSEKELRRNLAKFGLEKTVIVMVMKSEALVVDEMLKFVFIDGDHRYQEVKKDWEKVKDHVRVGGLVFFHDCDEEGPNRVVNEINSSDNEWGHWGQVDSLVGFRRVK